MKKRKKWYGIFANNGLGIYSNYGKYVNDRTYMRGERIKGFIEQEEAEDFAITGFEDLNGVEARMQAVGNLDCFRPNYFYFYRRKETDKENG